MRRSSRAVLLTTVLALVIAACGSDGDATESTLAPDVTTILTTAATTMGEVETVRFTLARGGAPIYIDPTETLEFVSAEGRYAAPSSADAVVVISVGDLRAQIGAVAIDGATWLTNPITGDWEPAPAGYSFDPAVLFDPDQGWRPLLADELVDPELVGLEDRNGEMLYHVRGTAGADRIKIITAGLVGQDVVLDLWLQPTDGAVREARFTTVYQGEESDWTLTFFDYGVELEIDIPDLEGES